MCELDITAPVAEWAENITRVLIEQKLVACGSLPDPHHLHVAGKD